LHIYWGLAGADLESDFILLNSELEGYFKDTYFKIVNDSWIVFLIMSEKDLGAVSICGTGKNIVIKDVDGKIYGISVLKYIFGSYDGGSHLSDIVMHYAFGSNKSTGMYTKLEEYLPQICQAVERKVMKKIL
jgi:N-acetylglucosamine kinase-like BadF-type ATPase